MSYRDEDKELSRLLSVAYESVKSKQGLVEALQSHPSIAARCSMDSAFGSGFQSCLDMFSPSVDVWKVKLYSSLGSIDYFVRDRGSLRAFLDGEIEKVRRPEKAQSPKVLAKMVAVRLSRVRSSVDELQAALARNEKALLGYIAHIEKDGKADGPLYGEHQQNLGLTRLTAERFTFPDLRTLTVPSLSTWLQAALEKIPLNGAPRPYVDLSNFVARPDVTEEMLRMACDMVLVGEVMES